MSFQRNRRTQSPSHPPSANPTLGGNGLEQSAYPFQFEVWPTEQRLIAQTFNVNAADYAQLGLAGCEGLDIAAPIGSPIFCVASGIIKEVYATVTSHSYGNHVCVQHADGYETVYAHLQSVLVEPGEPVTAGTVLGLADSTGNNTYGNCLHFTLKQDGATRSGCPHHTIDPTPFLMPLLITQASTVPDGARYCCDRVADGSHFAPGATINQSWTMHNSGTTTWDASYQLVFLSGERLGQTTAIPAPPTTPGTEAEFTVAFTAPATPGTYRGYWRMRNTVGQWFGDRLWIDIVVEQAIQPLEPIICNKLGFYLHLSLDQHGLWEAIRRVQPPILLVHADTVNTMLLEEIRQFRAPDAFVIGRLYKDGHTQRQMLESNDPAGQGRALAEEILQYNYGLATKRDTTGRLLIDAWMSLNEAIPGPASAQFHQQPEETAHLLRNYDHFQVAFRQRLQEAGVEAVAFNFGAGNFATAEHYLQHFPNTLAAYVYLGFHEYGWPTLYPAPGTATSGGLYRDCMAGIRAHYGERHRVIITEAGLTRMYQNPAGGDIGWLNDETPLTEEHYWQSLAWYNDHLVADAYVLGACLYEVGHHGDWGSFRHLGQDQRGHPITLIDRIVALKERAQRHSFAPATPTAPLMPGAEPVFSLAPTAIDAHAEQVDGRDAIELLSLAVVSHPEQTTETSMAANPMAGYIGAPLTIGSKVTVVASIAQVQPAAGNRRQSPQPVVATLSRGADLIVHAAPVRVDGLDWLQVQDIPQGRPGAKTVVNGWLAIAEPSGVRLLAPADVAAALRVRRPFAAHWALSQGWGAWPALYRQITYDGVPLKGHNGLDFAMPVGTAVLAVDAGVVKRVDFEIGGFGHFILIEHAWGESLYAHLSRVDVRPKAAVTAGQAMALSGATGRCYGAHLHFGIRLFPYCRTDGWGGFCDPTPFLDPATGGTRHAPTRQPALMEAESSGCPRP